MEVEELTPSEIAKVEQQKWLTKGQDYKEKHKLDSKQISNSPC